MKKTHTTNKLTWSYSDKHGWVAGNIPANHHWKYRITSTDGSNMDNWQVFRTSTSFESGWQLIGKRRLLPTAKRAVKQITKSPTPTPPPRKPSWNDFTNSIRDLVQRNSLQKTIDAIDQDKTTTPSKFWNVAPPDKDLPKSDLPEMYQSKKKTLLWTSLENKKFSPIPGQWVKMTEKGMEEYMLNVSKIPSIKPYLGLVCYGQLAGEFRVRRVDGSMWSASKEYFTTPTADEILRALDLKAGDLVGVFSEGEANHPINLEKGVVDSTVFDQHGNMCAVVVNFDANCGQWVVPAKNIHLISRNPHQKPDGKLLWDSFTKEIPSKKPSSKFKMGLSDLKLYTKGDVCVHLPSSMKVVVEKTPDGPIGYALVRVLETKDVFWAHLRNLTLEINS